MIVEEYTERLSVKREVEVVELVKEFYNESLSEFGQKLNLEALHEAIERMLKHSFLLIVDGRCVGVLAGMDVTTPYSRDKIYHEVVWFVSKSFRKYGVWLLDQAQRVLKAEGYSHMIMTVMHNSMTEKLISLYERIGFRAIETHYVKEL